MKIELPRFVTALFTILAISLPVVALAQTVTNVQNLFAAALEILNDYVVPLIFGLAFLMFLYGVYRYFIAGGANEEKVQEGQKFVLWSVVGFVLMFSIWGIINLFINTLGFDTTSRPAFPTFGSGTTGTSFITNNGSDLFGSGSGSNTFGNSSNLVNGQPFTDPITGQQFTATGPNTFQPVNGNCGSTGTLTGSQCVQNGTNAPGTFGGPSAISGMSKGGSCSITSSSPDGNCEGALICTNGTCQTDPQLENGDGTVNSACVPPGDCDGDMICDTNSDTCQEPSTPGVNDGTNNPTVGDGTLGSSCIPPGDCDGDMICDTNSDTCEQPSDTNANDGNFTYCSDGSVVPNGGACASCPDGSTTADPNLCPEGTTSNGYNSGGGVPSQGNTGS